VIKYLGTIKPKMLWCPFCRHHSILGFGFNCDHLLTILVERLNGVPGFHPDVGAFTPVSGWNPHTLYFTQVSNAIYCKCFYVNADKRL